MVMHDNTTPHPRASAFSDIEDIIADIRDGKMVIMVDDENRENEGDLIMAAGKVRAEDINYMARYGRGLICLTLVAGTLLATSPAINGSRHRRTSRDEFHLIDRSCRGHHDRYLGA